MNYWKGGKPDEFCNIENSCLRLSGTPVQLQRTDVPGQNGAYKDLLTNIQQGHTYGVRCRVRAAARTTARFRLWIHDIDTTGSDKFEPNEEGVTPSIEFQEMTLRYGATQTNKLRIHLHYFAGQGIIYVDKVEVFEIQT